MPQGTHINVSRGVALLLLTPPASFFVLIVCLLSISFVIFHHQQRRVSKRLGNSAVEQSLNMRHMQINSQGVTALLLKVI